MRWTWTCWRLIEAGKVTFTEVSEKMSIMDVLHLTDAMHAIHEAEERYRKQIEKKNA